MKQNHNVYDINIQRCERPVIPSHTTSILAKSGHQECKRRSSARPKTAFCPTVDGLSQARLPPLHGISRPADPLPDTKRWPASTYTHAEKPPVRTGTQIFSEKTVHKIHALTLLSTIRLTSLKSHGCYRTNRHQTAGKTVKMHTSAQCAHFWAQQF